MATEKEIREDITRQVEQSNLERGVSPEETQKRIWQALALRTLIQTSLAKSKTRNSK